MITIRQEKWLRRGIAFILGVALLTGVILNTNAFAVEARSIDDIPSENAPSTKSVEEKKEAKNIPPTFTTEETDDSLRLKMGNNLLAFGNDLVATTDVPGLDFSFGNTIKTNNRALYKFIAGNTVSVSGVTEKDLFVAGNIVTISEDAKISGDVYGATNELIVKADLPGDLAVTASTIRLENVNIAGNVDLSAEKVVFDGTVNIQGVLTTNDNIIMVGEDNAKYDSLNTYHIEEPDTSLVTVAYGKIFSALSLFIAMVVIFALSSRTHEHIARATNPRVALSNLAIGSWILLLVPLVALFLLCTVIGAPLGLILIALYIIAIYLSQGFAGAWLGHQLIEKVFKSKSNLYLETIVGILILGALSLVPYVGEITGLLAMLLGLGLMVSLAKPSLDTKAPKQIKGSNKDADSTKKASKDSKKVQNSDPDSKESY